MKPNTSTDGASRLSRRIVVPLAMLLGTLMLVWYAGSYLIDRFRPLPYFMTRIESVPTLIKQLKSVDANTRFNAAQGLGAWQDPRAVEPLKAALQDPDEQVVRAAIESLGRIGDHGAVASLLGVVIDKQRDLLARIAAIDALTMIRDNRSVVPLIKALDDDALATAAARALGSTGDQRAIEPLIRKLTSKDYLVRSSTAEALGRIGDKAAVPALIGLLHDSERNVRCSAVEALGELHDERGIEPLIGSLKDEDERVREQAAFSLGVLGDKRASDPLKGALSDQDEGVRRQAEIALEKMRGR